MEQYVYKDYFNINPKFYPVVTEELINEGKVKWTDFYPHTSFVELLKATHVMLSRKELGSLWIEGAYGTGKSHAALTIKSMLEASDGEIREYFNDYGLDKDLCQKLITDKNAGTILTVHRIGSSSIHSDQDLILAVQQSIVDSLKEHNIQNHGEGSLKEAALKWYDEKEATRRYFNDLVSENRYFRDFGGKSGQAVMDELRNCQDKEGIENLMRKILKVANDNGISALKLDIDGLVKWIKSVIKENNLNAIVFVWDEFTEFFTNNQNSLTGFQTLLQMSGTSPFYFLLVTHESTQLIGKNDRSKILDRFIGRKTIKIDMPDNMAFKLMAQALRKSDDPKLAKAWNEYKDDLNSSLASARKAIIDGTKADPNAAKKALLSDEDLKGVLPIHPYAALLLKHMSVVFNSNARSMFDFIISDEDMKGFKWYINNYGPLKNQDEPLLTVDMLWDFFNGKDKSGLGDDICAVLSQYDVLKKDQLTADETKVFKTLLLQEAISLRVNDVKLLRPSEDNINLAFSGTWPKNKAGNLLEALQAKGFVFEKPGGNGSKEYTAANNLVDKSKLIQYRAQLKENTKTAKLVTDAELLAAIALPFNIKNRFTVMAACDAFTTERGKLAGTPAENKIKVLVTFAKDEIQAGELHNKLIEQMKNNKKAAGDDPWDDDIIYVECTTPMGKDLFDQYVENMARSMSFTASDGDQAGGYQKSAEQNLAKWKNNVISGGFIIYNASNPSGKRLATLAALHSALEDIDFSIYPYGLERHKLGEDMFKPTALAQGAECALLGKLSGRFENKTNPKLRPIVALDGMWGVENYWKNEKYQGLAISKLKNEVDLIISESFKNNAGRVSVLSIFLALQKAPYGFMYNNISAFVMGFLLKEYVSPAYYWSDGTTSEVMSTVKMKEMIKNAMDHANKPTGKYKVEYLVSMDEKQRAFLKCTSKAFNIEEKYCASIESARDKIREKMRTLEYPIWCLKNILPEKNFKTPVSTLESAIDAYCAIANTGNTNTAASESSVAGEIGDLAMKNESLADDLQNLLTTQNCKDAMLSYLASYKGGELKNLGAKIGDGGAYIDVVKSKFSDAATWVWSSQTINEKIDDAILEYKIILKSNEIGTKCTKLDETIAKWIKEINYIRLPYDYLKTYAHDVDKLLSALYELNRFGKLEGNNKEAFYNALVCQLEAFKTFHGKEPDYFKSAMASYLTGLDDRNIRTFFAENVEAGQFSKSSGVYDSYIKNKLDDYKKGLKKQKLKDLWLEKTGTESPRAWSNKYRTPILSMFDDAHRPEARSAFRTLNSSGNDRDSDIERAMEFLNKASFYSDLNDEAKREACFKERVLGDYAIILTDLDEVRRELGNKESECYNWSDNDAIKNVIKALAEKKYTSACRNEARKELANKDKDELLDYLDALLLKMDFGLQILKNKQEREKAER